MNIKDIKVGMLVKRIKCGHRAVNVNDVCTVTRIAGTGTIELNNSNDPVTMWHDPVNLEFVKPTTLPTYQYLTDMIVNQTIEIGDLVERHTDCHFELEVGDQGIVSKFEVGDTIRLKGYKGSYSKDKFTVIKKKNQQELPIFN